VPGPKSGTSNPSLRICLVYDRLYPWSVGGAERWYRALAEQLASDGHHVTYLTTRHWPLAKESLLAGVEVVALGTAHAIYFEGRRRSGPLLRFSMATAVFLLRHGGEFDAIHTSTMSGPGAMSCVLASVVHRRALVLDWWEVWTLDYWRDYAGRGSGTLGWLLQALLARAPHQPITYSQLHARRLRSLRPRGRISISRGPMHYVEVSTTPAPAEQVVVYLGRHIPEKQVAAIPPAILLARSRLPGLRATLFGTGPDMAATVRAVHDAGLDDAIDLPGFVSEDIAMDTLGRALCLVLLSRREGFGLVVVEAAARGVPSLVLSHEDSAAAELIEEGVNGFLCSSRDPGEVASAILRIYHAGYALRQRTLDWYRANTNEWAAGNSLSTLLSAYRGAGIEERWTG
jgi:glycosyltransferase involved in cell wall biosynthesis